MNEEYNINGQKYVLAKEESVRVENNKDDNGNQECTNVVDCNNSTWCHNSTDCNDSTRCNNSVYCLYCDELVLEKYCLFNKQVSKERYGEQKSKIFSHLGLYKHPSKLTDEAKKWLKNNISEYDEEVLIKVIDNSVLPDKHMEQ